jgi:hypothetical protein
MRRFHKHVCRCGSFLVCPLPAELCSLKSWDCPACTDREMDAHFSRIADADALREQTAVTARSADR